MNLLLDTPIALWWLGDTPELPDTVREVVQDSDNVELPIRWEHAKRVEALPMLHRDPFDRLLIEQAQALGLTLVTTDGMIRKYSVNVLPFRA